MPKSHVRAHRRRHPTKPGKFVRVKAHERILYPPHNVFGQLNDPDVAYYRQMVNGMRGSLEQKRRALEREGKSVEEVDWQLSALDDLHTNLYHVDTSQEAQEEVRNLVRMAANDKMKYPHRAAGCDAEIRILEEAGRRMHEG